MSRPFANAFWPPLIIPLDRHDTTWAAGGVSANLLEALRRGLPDRPDYAPLDRLAASVEPVAQGLRLDVRASESAGGAARSRLWLKLKSDALGIAFRPVGCPEPTCLGAAILAEAASPGRTVNEVARSWISFGTAASD